MTLPHLDIRHFYKDGAIDIALYSWALANKLNKSPYVCVLDGFHSAPYDERQFFALMHAVGQHAGALKGANRPVKRPSYTKVRISPQEAGSYTGVTGYSRTNLPLDLHTDSSYMPVPHEFIGFQCVVADADGGENSYATVDEVIDQLSPKSLKRLQETVYPFGKAEHSVISLKPKPTIRYYRGQLDYALEQGAPLEDDQRQALQDLDTILTKLAGKNRFKLSPGQALVFNNHKALHGRTGFAEDSSRMLIRIRSHLDLHRLGRQKLPFWSKLAIRFGNSTHVKEPQGQSFPTEEGDDYSALGEVPEYFEALENGVKVDLEEITLSARQALKLGRLQEAHDLSIRCIERDKNHIEAHYNLAAIAQFRGDSISSESHLSNACKIRMYNKKFENDGRPKLLTVRGLKGCKYTLLKRAEGYIKSVQRGHFSLQNLYQPGAFDKVGASLFDTSQSGTEEQPVPDIIVNTVACGDHMPETLKMVGKFCKNFPGIPVINRPERVAAATRINNYERLSKIDGVIYPKTLLIKLKHGEEAASGKLIIDSGLYFPMIVRPSGTHTGTGMALVHSEEELLRYLHSADEGEHYAIQHYELADKRGLYSKTRVFFINGALHTVAGLIHNHWNVHSGDRYSVMDKNPWMQAREKEYLKDIKGFYGVSVVNSLMRISEIMQLDFFGVDFTVTDEGKLFVFEANAAMRHNFDHASAFPYTRPYLQAVSNAFQQMLMKRAGILDV